VSWTAKGNPSTYARSNGWYMDAFYVSDELQRMDFELSSRIVD